MIKNKVGIDRIVLKELDIKQMDKEILINRGFVVIQDSENNIRIMKDRGEDIGINYIKVSKTKDKSLLINELVIGCKEIERNVLNKLEYERLDITLPKAISQSKTNEENISNTDDLKESLKAMEEDLEGLGFGKVDLLKAEIKELEINVNIELEKEFIEYERVLEYLRDLLPNNKNTSINNSYKPKGKYTGFKTGNQSIILKMYDKRENIKRLDSRDIGKEQLRIEYKLMNEKKIRDIFKTIKLNEIVKDDFKGIDQAFKSILKKDLVDRVYKDIDRQIRHAEREIEKCKDIGGISATDLYLKNHQADLLDIEILLEGMRKTERVNHYSRNCKKVIRSAKEIEGINLYGNIKKLNEILENLEMEKIENTITKGIKKEVEKHL